MSNDYTQTILQPQDPKNLVPQEVVTASDSETITKYLRKYGIRLYEVLLHYYGVEAWVYRLKTTKEPTNDLHGYLDDDNAYEPNPFYQGKIIAPSLFKRRETAQLTMLDPFSINDNFIYTPADILLPLSGFVVFKLKSGSLYNFRISIINPIMNDGGVIIQRYGVVAVMSVNDLIKLDENIPQQDDLNHGYTTTEPDTNDNSTISYNPVEFD